MKNKKLKNLLSLVIEPISLGLFALLLIIPTITVVNLKPVTKKIEESSVLGLNETAELEINLIGGTHQILTQEKLKKDEDGAYKYTTVLASRDANRYSKPILEIKNSKPSAAKLEVYGYTHLPTRSDISIIINDQIYRLQNTQGNTTTQRILLEPNQRYIVYLAIESFSNIQFSEDFTLEIKELEQ